MPPHNLSTTQSPYTIKFVTNTLPQHNPISLNNSICGYHTNSTQPIFLHKSVCGHHTTSAQHNLPTQFSLWPLHYLSTTKSPYTIPFVATTLLQHNSISLHNLVSGHHSTSAPPNLHTQFSLWPTHCLSTNQSP
jgi:hypothetical protein